ncbi:hypothetical protein ACW5XW_08295 [Aeromonas piscicola]|uniref:hypothetical protein n=1 Tax=Aeromonas piscicola TaxID=600645 RepID=UPI0005B37C59|nr:hypothetical protein [Aeromonas piscicola]
MNVYAVMTRDLRVMRVMRTERGAKRYATKRGHCTVGLMASASTVSTLFRKQQVWHGMTRSNGSAVTGLGWATIRLNVPAQVKFVRGADLAAKFFNGSSS